MLTSHVMAEFTLGWFFLFFASRKEPLGADAVTRAAPGGIAAHATPVAPGRSVVAYQVGRL